ncbi:hypothetical protein INT45_009185 [Circinella minor]|uniref:Kelch repeat protein n=1 Tax=Circinella minor TaxID=1195481 RepID=A0A8H7SEU8_9FUNG|nr:hypothetical protein INT45_009185 [Circinella minor]
MNLIYIVEQSCVSLDLRIYCYGGSYVVFSSNNSFDSLNDFYYLDVAQDLTVSSSGSAWQQVHANGTIKPEANSMFGMVVLPERNTIVVTGGAGNVFANQSISNPTLAYDARANEWHTLSSNAGRQSYAAGTAASSDGKIYVFGGISDQSTGEVELTDTRNMRIYNYNANQWRMLALPDQYYSYAWHTGVMGNDGRTIYYIAGEIEGYFKRNNGSLVYGVSDNTLDKILTFNTETSLWNELNATGDAIPSSRMWHTAVRTGSGSNVSSDFCWVLTTTDITWKQINLSSSAGAGARFGHSAAFPENSPMMFVMFGVDSNLHQRTDFQVLNTDTWEWIDRYEGPGRNLTNENKPQTPSNNGDDGNNGVSGGAIAGAVVGSIAGVAVIAGILVLILRRRRQQQQRSVIKTSNEKNSNDDAREVVNSNISYQTQSPPPQYMQYYLQKPQQQVPHQQVTGMMSSPITSRTLPLSEGSSYSQNHTSPTTSVLPFHQRLYYTPNLRLEPVKPDGADS